MHTTITMHWRGFTIRATYTARYFKSMPWDHLEIESIPRVPLPVTETGYRSRFLPECHEPFDIETEVREWLDEEAAKPSWKETERQLHQGDLFDSFSLP